MDALVVLIPLLPFLASLIIGLGILSGVLDGETKENRTSGILLWTVYMSCLLSLTLLGADLTGANRGTVHLGFWFASDNLKIPVNFITTGLNVRLAALFSLLLAVVCRFSVNYMHRETGFHRFFFTLGLFCSAMLLLVLSGNTVGTFFGWEIAGLCSYLLIAYVYERPAAVFNATRVFVTNRIGDTAFILGIGLGYIWADNVNWLKLNDMAERLTFGEATGIALCFTVAALVKSAQLPFSPWLGRAMEGPTPSSAVFYGAVMVHAGVFLVILMHPVIEKTAFVMILLAAVGLFTACYGFYVGLTQTDIKSSLIFAVTAQLGLMFFECGMGWWRLAEWHLCAHAVVRCAQFLTAPSLLHNLKGVPVKTVRSGLFRQHWAYTASLHRFWLEPIVDWTLVKPVSRLGQDLAYFDDFIVDRSLGSPAPAISAISSLAQMEEQNLGARLDNDSDDFAQGSGFAGKLTAWFAAVVHWFEERFVLRGIGKETLHYGRRIGYAANRFEQLILRPRYLVLFVFITFLVAF
jgi:NADH:ubiquinone oxidoreductase subunit 5 (subunit L)/multisubunit Na+/H+ antiporter MnhA subunit